MRMEYLNWNSNLISQHKMKNYLKFIVLVLLSCSSPDDPPKYIGGTPGVSYRQKRTLKGAATFYVGVASDTRWLTPSYAYLIDHVQIRQNEFTSMTPLFEMNQNIIHVDDGEYDWSLADRLVEKWTSWDMRIHGHTLVWHKGIPEWLENLSGADEEFSLQMEEYIQATVQHFKGQVASWDVVNEALEEDGSLRENVFYRRMGEDYMAKCFQSVREWDSTALLFYNEQGIAGNFQKLRGLLDLIDDFKNRGIPIDGVGIQMHVQLEWPSAEQIQQTVDSLVSRGLLIHFSAVDIQVNADGKLKNFTPDIAYRQEYRVTEIVKIYQTIPRELQYGMTFWGMKDDDSWLIEEYGHPEWPLLFDKGFNTKFAHRGFVEAF